ncbi:hypothetical protein F4780DRAFT_283346 [Xylariomycetidae sp. FL0641]|nr:hypothetical protein F4780DRAFT_283346 [Xylariomycetidae sp. FL0641]
MSRCPDTDEIETENFNMLEFLETQDVHPQLSSPLYYRIPAEIRDLIFKFALTEHPYFDAGKFRKDAVVRFDHEPVPPPKMPVLTSDELKYFLSPVDRMSLLNPHNHKRPQQGFDWLRPDNTERGKGTPGLLLTCRRVYLETQSYPLLLRTHVFYCGRGPSSSTSDPAALGRQRMGDATGWSSLSSSSSSSSSSQASPPTPGSWLAGVEDLRLTLRRADWWDWERNTPLKINPYRGNCWGLQSVYKMRSDMAACYRQRAPRSGGGDGDGEEEKGVEEEEEDEEEEEEALFGPDTWGRVFEHLPRLRRLTIDFETAEDKKAEMESIVAWAARCWRFPLRGCRAYLSAAGHPVEKMSWHGAPYHWSDVCVACRRHYVHRGDEDGDCAACRQRRELMTHGFGPRLYVWTLTWTPVKRKDVNPLCTW